MALWGRCERSGSVEGWLRRLEACVGWAVSRCGGLGVIGLVVGRGDWRVFSHVKLVRSALCVLCSCLLWWLYGGLFLRPGEAEAGVLSRCSVSGSGSCWPHAGFAAVNSGLDRQVVVRSDCQWCAWRLGACAWLWAEWWLVWVQGVVARGGPACLRYLCVVALWGGFVACVAWGAGAGASSGGRCMQGLVLVASV